MAGVPPFGQKYESGQLVRDEDECALLDRMIVMCKDESYSVVAGTLNAEGKLNRGKFWNPATVRYLVVKESEGD